LAKNKNAVTLSDVSALKRLGVDPWGEAARLALLPKARAAETLAKLIARLPEPSNATIGRFGHQPAVGRALAGG
jgi:hypothetical protein